MNLSDVAGRNEMASAAKPPAGDGEEGNSTVRCPYDFVDDADGPLR
jgi:hypothetical protein